MEMVDIRPLKRMVKRDFPNDSSIRNVILSEPDSIPKEEYAIKLLVWLKLLPKRFK